jgi:hypothetical protein
LLRGRGGERPDCQQKGRHTACAQGTLNDLNATQSHEVVSRSDLVVDRNCVNLRRPERPRQNIEYEKGKKLSEQARAGMAVIGQPGLRADAKSSAVSRERIGREGQIGENRLELTAGADWIEIGISAQGGLIAKSRSDGLSQSVDRRV